jgi:hypothetical protein
MLRLCCAINDRLAQATAHGREFEQSEKKAEKIIEAAVPN